MHLQHFGLLKKPVFRTYFIGQFLSMAGTWMQAMVLSWVVYEMSGSAKWLGIVNFLTLAPAFFLSPLAGWVADHFNRKHVLILTQVIGALQAFGMAYLIFFGHLTLLWIAFMTFVLGVNNAFEMTSRHSFAVDMVGREDLSSAIALNSVLVTSCRSIGPAIGAAILKPLGEGWVFLLNGLSFFAVIYGIVNVPYHRARHLAEPLSLRTLFSGMSYVRQHRHILEIVLIATFISVFGVCVSVLLPVVAKQVLGGDEQTLAYLSAAIGLGSVMGALNVDPNQSPAESRRTLRGCMIFLGAAIVLCGLSKQLLPVLVSVTMVGFFIMWAFPLMNNSVQKMTEDHYQGRVLSVYTMSYQGGNPVGSMICGKSADHFGVMLTMVTCGLLCFLGGSVWGLKRYLTRLKEQ